MAATLAAAGTVESYAKETAWMLGADVDHPHRTEDSWGDSIPVAGQAWAQLARPNRRYRPAEWAVREAIHDLAADADTGIKLGFAAGGDRPDIDELLDWAASLLPRRGTITDQEIEALR